MRVHIMSKSYARRTPDNYAQYAESVAEFMEEKVNDHEWYLDLLLTPIQFNLDQYDDLTGSLLIWFHAFGDTERGAATEREVYIARLSNCLLHDQSLSCLE